MIRRVLLINPNYALRKSFDFDLIPPFGIASIASILRERFEVAIVDADAEDLSPAEVIGKAREFGPDAVGISCNASPAHFPTLELASRLKKAMGVPVIAGGNHATAMAEILLASGDIDFVVCGEGERTSERLLLVLNEGPGDLRGVAGIAFLRDGKALRTQTAPLLDDIDSLPLPAYDLLPMSKYTRYDLVLSRGCPYRCTFCASTVIFRSKVRYRSAESVIAEIKYLLEHFGQKLFWFSDDNFSLNRKKTEELLDRLLEEKLDIRWRCHTRVNLISPDLLRKMRRAGCECVAYGIESGSEEMLRTIRKESTAEQAIEAVRLTKEAGMDAAAFFLVGSPGETESTVWESYELIKRAKPSAVSFCVTVPLPGSPLFEDLIGRGLLDPAEVNWDRFFARVPGHREREDYAAQLATRWCELGKERIMESCEVGDWMPRLGLILSLSEMRRRARQQGLGKLLRSFRMIAREAFLQPRPFFKALRIYPRLGRGEERGTQRAGEK